MIGAQAPYSSPVAEAQLRPGRPPPPLRTVLRAPVAWLPLAPSATCEQPVPPPGACLCLLEPAHPPSPGAPPPAPSSANGSGSQGLAPPLPAPPAATRTPQSRAPRARARGAERLGAGGGRRSCCDLKAARASEADICAHTHPHTSLAAGDSRGPRCQSVRDPSRSFPVGCSPRTNGSCALLLLRSPQASSRRPACRPRAAASLPRSQDLRDDTWTAHVPPGGAAESP